MPKSVTLRVVNCLSCPNLEETLTKGFGYAVDYYCKIAIRPIGVRAPGPEHHWKDGDRGRIVAGYVEWNSQKPKDGQIPDWCPLLPKNKKKEVT
jgi:hypothetical protein